MRTKIKNIAQLRAEKKRIKQSEQALEEKLQNDWMDLRRYLHPGKQARESFNALSGNGEHKKMNGKDLLKAIISFGIDQATGKLIDKAGMKLSKLLRKKE